MTLTLTHILAALALFALLLVLLRWQGVFGSTLLRAAAFAVVGAALFRWVA